MSPEIIFLLGLLVVFELGIHIFSIIVIVPIFERQLPFDVPSTDPMDDAEPVVIRTSDGLNLRGAVYLPSGEPLGVVIFCPEFQGNHWMVMDYCCALRDVGFAVLSFDFRGQGESDAMDGYRPLHWLTDYEIQDLQSVVSFVRSDPTLNDLPIGLMGTSRGANAALAVAAMDDEIKCVVADSAFTTDTLMYLYAARWVRYYAPNWFRLPEWHLRISCRLARIVSQWRRNVRYSNLTLLLPALRRRDVLLIAGQRDSYVPPESSRRIHRRIGGDSQAWYVPKAKHNSARHVDPVEYDKRIVALFLEMTPLHRSEIPVDSLAERPGLLPAEGPIERVVD